MAKLILYIMVIPLTVWAVDSLNLNNLFKKNKIVQSRLFYAIIILIISYNLVEFFYNFLHILD